MTVTPRREREITHWDHETDVVVVGFGAAGASAAYEAALAGAEVLVLERAGAAGGAAAMSHGQIYLGGGTPTQQACGFDDSAEEMRKFLIAACGPDPDEAKISLYCERSLEHYDWLLARGVCFRGAFWADQGPSPETDEGLMYTGGEDAHPFDKIAIPAPRGHIVQGSGSTGAVLMKHLSRAAIDAGAKELFDTRVDRLVVDELGRVTGVIASQYAVETAIRARRGVVLAAGGFIFNDTMLHQYAPILTRTPIKIGTEGDDGRGIRMAQAAGAQTRRMDAGECALPFIPPRSQVRGILVNQRGQRYINEDTYMGRIGQHTLMREDGQAYLIVDEASYVPLWVGSHAAWVCETPHELEAEMALPPGSLVATLDYYNQHAGDGKDPLFHKGSAWLSPLVPPLAAFDLRMDRFPYAPFTLGGLATLPTGEVLDLDGDPVAGLFAAGRTTSGICAGGYCSGLSVGDSTFFGRLAGQSSARTNRSNE